MPWIAPLVAVGIGAYQTARAASQKKKYERQLEAQANLAKPNQSIMDYYSKALQRYSVNPYQSNLYKEATASAGRGLATGIGALQDRRSALGGIAPLVQQYNDATRRAAAMAEGQQGSALGQLGQASGLKTQEDRYPFELKYNLLGMKAGGANQMLNAGMQNVYGGLSSAADMYAINKMYGNKKPK